MVKEERKMKGLSKILSVITVFFVAILFIYVPVYAFDLKMPLSTFDGRSGLEWKVTTQAGEPRTFHAPDKAYYALDFGRGQKIGDKTVVEIKGQPVLAAAGGSVVSLDSSFTPGELKRGSNGNYVIVDHHNGVYTLYAHLDKVEVSVGNKVVQGQPIGKVGSTGDSHDEKNNPVPHLHFQVKYSEKGEYYKTGLSKKDNIGLSAVTLEGQRIEDYKADKFYTENDTNRQVREQKTTEVKQSMTPPAKQTPRINVVPTLLSTAKIDAVKMIEMPKTLPMNLPQGNISDASKVKEGTPHQLVTPVAVEFTQTFDGLFTQSANSRGSRDGIHSGTLTDGTRVNVKGDSVAGDFTGSFSGQSVGEPGYTPATHTNSAFSGSSVGTASAKGLKEGDLKGTMTVTIPSGTQTTNVTGNITIKTDGSLSMPSYTGPTTDNATGVKVGTMSGEWSQSKTR